MKSKATQCSKDTATSDSSDDTSHGYETVVDDSVTTQCHVKKQKQRQTSSAWEAFAKVSLHGGDHMECLLCTANPPIHLSLLGSTTISMLTYLWQHHSAELVQFMHGDESVVPPRAERPPMSESFASPICQDKREDSVLQIAVKDEMELHTVEPKSFFERMNALHRRTKPLNADTLPRKVTQTHAFELEKVKLRMAQVDAMISISPGEKRYVSVTAHFIDAVW